MALTTVALPPIIYRNTYVFRVLDARLLPTLFELLACHLAAASSKLVLANILYRPSNIVHHGDI